MNKKRCVEHLIIISTLEYLCAHQEYKKTEDVSSYL